MKLFKVTYAADEYGGERDIYHAAPSFTALAEHLQREHVLSVVQVSDYIHVVDDG